MKLVLATSNAGKIRELRALLRPLGIDAIAQTEWNVEPVEETADTFAGNALLKARHASLHTGLASLADDSGLEVDALAGNPGVRSARYAGEQSNDADNNSKLLRELTGVSAANRSARYRCVLALVRSAHDPAPLLCEGTWDGYIAEAAVGTNGFGYDPLFVVAGEGITAAQMDPEVKNAVSHRGQALRRLVKELDKWQEKALGEWHE